jgi:TonB family protein
LRALIRHQNKLRCGMEFIGLSAAQQTAIRQWSKDASAETELVADKTISTGAQRGTAGTTGESSGRPRRRGKRRRRRWLMGLLMVAALMSVFWLRWDRGWEELESGFHSGDLDAVAHPRAHVSPEVMEKLLIHKVDPDYPEAARPARLRGVIVLNVVVGRDGSVVNMRPLSGPDVLARAAMDAVRWWRYDPYRVNGEPAVVDTTVAVEFNP